MHLLRRRPDPGVESILVALGVAVLYLLLRSSPWVAPGAFNDDGVYLALGQAIAEGEGYTSIYAVGEPVHQKYPPGLPLVYAGLWRLGAGLGFVHAAALLLSLLLTATAAGLLWWVGRVRLGLGVAVAAFFVVGPLLLEGSVQYFNLALSEPWYMALWAGSLVLFPLAVGRRSGPGREAGEEDGPAPPEARAVEAPDRDGPRRLLAAAALGMVVALAVLFRSQGIALVPAVLAGMFLCRASLDRVGAFLVSAMVPVLGWRVWHARAVARGPVGTQPDEEGYVAWMPEGGVAELPQVIGDLIAYQLDAYTTYMPEHLSGLRLPGLLFWIAFTVLAVVAAGRLWRRHPDLVLGCGGTAAIILLWPWAQDRFALTLLPFLGLLVGSQVERWTRPPGRGRLIAACLAVLALAIALRQVQIRGVSEGELAEMEVQFHPAHYLRSGTRYVLGASSWILENTDPEATLLAPQPMGIWLHTGRKVVNSNPALPHVGSSIWNEPGRFIAERLVEDRPDLVVLSGLVHDITRDIATVQQACPAALRHLGASERFARVVFYEVRYEDPCLEERFLEPARRRLGGG